MSVLYLDNVQGYEKIGFKPEKIPRNTKNCVDCGHCCHGCPYEAKQSTLTALLEPLLLAQHPSATAETSTAEDVYKLQIIPDCEVSRILYEQAPREVLGGDGTTYACTKKAVGVEATVRIFDRNHADLSVKERLADRTERNFHTRFVSAIIVVSMTKFCFRRGVLQWLHLIFYVKPTSLASCCNPPFTPHFLPLTYVPLSLTFFFSCPLSLYPLIPLVSGKSWCVPRSWSARPVHSTPPRCCCAPGCRGAASRGPTCPCTPCWGPAASSPTERSVVVVASSIQYVECSL
jgi:hypothetical protein